jgi:hypothetical protein
MVGNACLSQPRNNGRDMVVETMYSISILRSIVLCLSDVVFLQAKKVVLLICLLLLTTPYVLASNFEVSLPGRDFEESLARMVLGPDLILGMDLFFPRVAPTFLLIHPLMVLLTVFLHSVQRATYVCTAFASGVSSVTSQAIEEEWRACYGGLGW